VKLSEEFERSKLILKQPYKYVLKQRKESKASGDGSTAASSGNGSTAASSGTNSTAASSGEKTIAVKLSEELERYKLILKQLDSARQRLFDLGFMTEPEEFKLEKFIVGEKVRVDKMLKAFRIAPSQVPTGIPSLDAANKVAARVSGASEVLDYPDKGHVKAADWLFLD